MKLLNYEMMEDEYIDIDAEILEPTEPSSFGTSFPGPFLYINDSYIPCHNASFCNGSGSENDGDEDDFSHIAWVFTILIPILFGLIVVVGLIGNTLVVLVVSCNAQMRSTTNILIINLAVADLLFIMFCVPFTAWDYAFYFWVFGEIWCRIVQYLIVVCAYASIYTLVLMSLDRFLAVVHPITSMSIRTVHNALIAIGVMWSVIIISCIPALLSHGEIKFPIGDTEYSLCRFLDNEGYNRVAFQLSFFLSSYVVPLALIFVLYVLMLKRLWFGVAPGGHVSAEGLKAKKRVTKMVVVVVLIFAVCWCPVNIVLMLKSVDAYPMNTVPRVLFQVASHVLAYMNSCVNPILYAFLSENFRKAFHKVVQCGDRRQHHVPRTTTGENKTERETTLNNGTSRNAAHNHNSSVIF